MRNRSCFLSKKFLDQRSEKVFALSNPVNLSIKNSSDSCDEPLTRWTQSQYESPRKYISTYEHKINKIPVYIKNTFLVTKDSARCISNDNQRLRTESCGGILESDKDFQVSPQLSPKKFLFKKSFAAYTTPHYAAELFPEWPEYPNDTIDCSNIKSSQYNDVNHYCNIKSSKSAHYANTSNSHSTPFNMPELIHKDIPFFDSGNPSYPNYLSYVNLHKQAEQSVPNYYNYAQRLIPEPANAAYEKVLSQPMCFTYQQQPIIHPSNYYYYQQKSYPFENSTYPCYGEDMQSKIFDKILKKKEKKKEKKKNQKKKKISNSLSRSTQMYENSCQPLENRHNSQEDTGLETTVMLRNIPNKYTQKMLLNIINERYQSLYDFFYLPIDFRNKCNVGYAFINFINPGYAQHFKQEFHGFKLGGHKSHKVCEVSWGRVQGLAANIEHYKNSAIMSVANPEYKPMLLHNGIPVIFCMSRYAKLKQSFKKKI